MNRLAVSFLSLLTLAPALLAQGTEHDLGTQVKAGTTVWFAEHANNESTIDMAGQEMTTAQKLTRNFRITVKELTADGNHVVEVEVARIFGTFDVPMLGEMKIDSAGGAEGDDDEGGFGMEQLDELKTKLTEMANRKYLARVGRDGKVVGAVRELGKDGKETEGEDEGGVKQLVESAFGLRPKTKIAEGGSWDFDQDQSSGQMPMKAKAKAKLVKVSDDLFETSVEGALEKNAGAKLGDGAEDDEEAAMQAEMLEGMTIENGKMTGKQQLSRKDGLLMDSNTTMAADIAMETPIGSMSMKVKTVTTIKRITEAEARPAKKEEKKEDGDK